MGTTRFDQLLLVAVAAGLLDEELEDEVELLDDDGPESLDFFVAVDSLAAGFDSDDVLESDFSPDFSPDLSPDFSPETAPTAPERESVR